jgi:hypothetical protein
MYCISETFHGFVHTVQALWVHYVVADYVAFSVRSCLNPRYSVILLPGAEGRIIPDLAGDGSRQEAGLYFQHSSVADFVAEDGMNDLRLHAAFVA